MPDLHEVYESVRLREQLDEERRNEQRIGWLAFWLACLALLSVAAWFVS